MTKNAYKHWTIDESRKLVYLVEKYTINNRICWKSIAPYFENRSLKQLRAYYINVLQSKLPPRKMPLEQEALFIIKWAINYFDLEKTQKEMCPEIDKEYLQERAKLWDDFYYRFMYNYQSLINNPRQQFDLYFLEHERLAFKLLVEDNTLMTQLLATMNSPKQNVYNTIY